MREGYTLVTYYTARLVQTSPEVKVEVCKWEDKSIPSNVYHIFPKTGSCDCVSTRRDCKHVRLANDLLDPEFINEMYAWRWTEKDGWIEANDMPFKAFVDAVLAS